VIMDGSADTQLQILQCKTIDHALLLGCLLALPDEVAQSFFRSALLDLHNDFARMASVRSAVRVSYATQLLPRCLGVRFVLVGLPRLT
jgi:hypothetical protein